VVVEPSLDSLEVAEKIHELAGQIDIADVWAVLNKITSEKITQRLIDYLNERDISVIGQVHQNSDIFESSLEGRPIQNGTASSDVDKILEFLFP